MSGCATRPRRHTRTRDVFGFWRAQLASGFFGICGGRARRGAPSHAASGCATDASSRAAPHGRVDARARAIIFALVVTVFGFWRARLASGFFGICGGRARRVASSHAASGCATDAARRAAPHGRVGARARAIILALVVTVPSLCADARDGTLAALALRSHSRPCLVAPQRCARPFARAALSLASRAPSPRPRPSLLWSSAATSARLRRALRSVSSNPCFDTSCRENGPRVRNLQWNPTSRILLRRRKFLRARTHYSRKVLRDCPAALRKLTTDRRRLPLPPRQLPLLRGQTQRQRLMSRLRHERRPTSRCGVSGARRVPNCPGGVFLVD